MRGRGLFVANTKNSVENTLNLGAGYMEVWNYPPVLCYPRDLYTLAVYTRDKKHSAYNLPGQHKQYCPNKPKQKIFFFIQTNSAMLRGLIPNCVNCSWVGEYTLHMSDITYPLSFYGQSQSKVCRLAFNDFYNWDDYQYCDSDDSEDYDDDEKDDGAIR